MHRIFLEDTQETGLKGCLYGGIPRMTRGQKKGEDYCLWKTKKVYVLLVQKMSTNKRTQLALPLWVLEETKTTSLKEGQSLVSVAQWLSLDP